jgi:hypothetical protein
MAQSGRVPNEAGEKEEFQFSLCLKTGLGEQRKKIESANDFLCVSRFQHFNFLS